MVFIGVKRTLGMDSSSASFFSSHLHPSTNKPLTYTPSPGPFDKSYLLSSEITSKLKSMVSMAMTYFLAKFYLAPVKND
jgi:hypothetical protein